MQDPASEQISKAIAEIEDTEPMKLNFSLQNHVSMDAIDDLVTQKNNSWRLQFETKNHVIEGIGDKNIIVDGEVLGRFY